MQGFEESGPAMVIGKALAVSVIISILMLLTSLGFMRIFSGVGLDMSIGIMLVVFAISFIASTVLLDRASDDLLGSFMAGAAVALGVTFFIVALVSGAYFLIDKTPLPRVDMLLAGFAACLIASLIVNRLTLKL
jgi:hypothetical protein